METLATTLETLLVELNNEVFSFSFTSSTEILAEDNWTTLGHRFTLAAGSMVNGAFALELMCFYTGRNILVTKTAEGKKNIQSVITY